MLLKEKSTQIKKHPSWEDSINIKKKFFLICLHSPTFVYTRLHLSRLVYNSLASSNDSSPLVYICLVTRLHSSTFVYTRLHLSRLVYNSLASSNDSSPLVYICLVTRLHSSTFVYTRLVSSSDSSVFLEHYRWEIWLDNSKNLLCIDQSGFYIFSHPSQFKSI